MNDQAISLEWISAAVENFSRMYDRDAMPWMQQASFDRGSFATLVGIVSEVEEDSVRVFTIGDSICVLINGDDIVSTIPYTQPEQFEQAPLLLASSARENRHLDADRIAAGWREFSLAGYREPVVLLLTDAIGAWLIEQPDNERVRLLLEAQDEQSFADLIHQERAEGRMRTDDTTMVVIGRSP